MSLTTKVKVAKSSFLNEKSYNKTVIDFNFGRHKHLSTSVNNHIPRDDIFDYHPIRECNIYIIYRQIKKFLALSLSGVVLIILINVKMSTIVGILTFMSRINFLLS